jgi:putative ABC transport system permease protein
MFWRVLRRSIFANRGRLFVILLALGAGSAVTAALLNLQVDAKRRITTEFRSFGANVIVEPRPENATESAALLNESVVPLVGPSIPASVEVQGYAMLLGTALARRKPLGSVQADGNEIPIVAAGYGEGVPLNSDSFARLEVASDAKLSEDPWVKYARCYAGSAVAAKQSLHVLDLLELRNGDRKVDCVVREIRSFGAPEDSQIGMNIRTAQTLLMAPGAISVVRLRISGSKEQIQKSVGAIQRTLDEHDSAIRRFLPREKAAYQRIASVSPERVDEVERRLSPAQVRPILQFTEGEARLYGKISGILTATVIVVLFLTALCVMAAMTNIAAERKNDVGLMKAIGGSVRRVLRIFLAEAALLGLAGGLIGAAVGIAISIGLGKAVFGVAAQPRLIVYPISVALTVIVAILAAYPLRRLTLIKPAAVFRGEE